MDIINTKKLLSLFEKESSGFKFELLKYYNEYIKMVSRRSWAMSLECSVFLMVLCHYLKPSNILDLGSGFSSFVFRYYSSKLKEQHPIIYSIDTSEVWLEKSKKFCADFKKREDCFQTWDELESCNEKKTFKLIFIDIGLKERETFVETVMDKFVDDRTVIVFDDFHYDPFRKRVEEILYDYHHNIHDIRNITLDSGGKKIRYCGMVDSIKRRNR